MTRKNRDSARLDAGLLDETHEAFGNPLNTLVDQNGNLTLYEVRLNEDEWTFLRDNRYANTGTYGPGGPQQQLNWRARPIQMPDNTNGVTRTGAIEIKAAWRQLCTDPDSCARVDDPSHFYTTTANYYERASGECKTVAVGLVGMHIAHKTHWAPQWVWSTFEHIENVPEPGASPADRVFSFYNPEVASGTPDVRECSSQRPGIFPPGHAHFVPGATACANLQMISNGLPGSKLIPNQLNRVDPISGTPLNTSFPAMLQTLGSEFQYYRLVNTQWPKRGRGSDGLVNRVACSEAKTGERCYEVVPSAGRPGHRLRNASMESYQVSYVNPDPGVLPPSSDGQFSSAGCMQCHSRGVDFSYVWTDAVEEPVPEVSRERP